jgi:exopolyphosphatase/guanosine-5'-triphosphate,3'-diphosphate pyrophosphatase
MSADPPRATAAPASERRAVIDVGTNSVKLLVADAAGTSITPVLEKSDQTRLGRGFYQSHRLQRPAIEHTAQAVRDFAQEARSLRAGSIRVIATSATREAVNQAELLAAIQQVAGLPVEVISGAQEAEWVYRGVTSDPRLAGQPLLILDVGGGSTEFIVGDDTRARFGHSFKLGAVRLLEQIRVSDPPAAGELAQCRRQLRQLFETEIAPVLRPVLASLNGAAVRLVGTGGSATILVAMELALSGFDRSRIEARELSLAEVSGWLERLWSLPIAQRRQLPGLPPQRADVILTGAAIYEAVMETFGFTRLRVSTRGLRFAAVMPAA